MISILTTDSLGHGTSPLIPLAGRLENRMIRRPVKGIRWWLGAALVGLIGLVTIRSDAEQLSSGTSSRRARQQAIEAVPFHQLNHQAREKITPVLEKPSIYRRLPITQIQCDPDYFVFLVRQPEVVVNIWQLMGITQMQIDRTGPYTMQTDDGVGATSNVELVYGTPNLHIFYARGAYVGPVLNRKLNGQCVILLRTDYLQDAEGQPSARSVMDVFLLVENATASLIARTLNPIVGSTADHNFVESLNFLQRLNETTAKNGPGVQQMAGRLVSLTPQVRNDFVKMAGLVYQRARLPKARTNLPVAKAPGSPVRPVSATTSTRATPVDDTHPSRSNRFRFRFRDR